MEKIQNFVLAVFNVIRATIFTVIKIITKQIKVISDNIFKKKLEKGKTEDEAAESPIKSGNEEKENNEKPQDEQNNSTNDEQNNNNSVPDEISNDTSKNNEENINNEGKIEEENNVSVQEKNNEKELLEQQKQKELELERQRKEEELKKQKEEEEKRLEKERKEKEEKERLEKEQKEREEKERLEREQKEREEKERLERERKEKEEREEKERLEREQKEREEKERLEREQKEKEEKERLEREQKEREEKERLEREEKERLEREQKEREEKEKKEREEKERLEREQKEKEERERKEREEKERLEREQKEKEEKERKEREEKERLEKEQKEREEKERLEREQKEKEEKERIEREKKEQEEKEQKEREEKEKQEREEKERLEKEQKEKEAEQAEAKEENIIPPPPSEESEASITPIPSLPLDSDSTLESSQSLEEIQVFDEKTLKKRQFAIAELCDSEQKYCSYLQQLSGPYKEALSPYIQLDEKRLIFQNIDALIILSGTFSGKFVQEAARGAKDAVMGHCFTDAQHLIKMFVPYIETYPEVELKIKELNNTNKKFKEACIKLERDGKEPLNSLIVMPIQRMPKYILLLKEILKATPTWHEDYKMLKDAMESLKGGSQICDIKTKEAAAKSHLYQLQTKIKDCPNLIAPSRTIIGQWPIAEERQEIFVLTDMLLIIKHKKKIIGGDFTTYKRSTKITEKSIVTFENNVITLKNGPNDQQPFVVSVVEDGEQIYNAIVNQIKEIQEFKKRTSL